MTLVKTGMYSWWLGMGLTSRKLLENAGKETEKLKHEVRERRCRAQREERKREDEEWWKKTHGINPQSRNPPFQCLKRVIWLVKGLKFMR